jgi:hypothetical protein
MVGETWVSDRGGGRANVKALAKLMDFHLDLVDENAPYGQLRAAEITLEADVVRAKLLQRDRQGHHAKFHMWHIRMAFGKFDDLDEMPETGTDLWLLIIEGAVKDEFSACEVRGVRGLILQLNVIDGVDKYVRLGIWGASIRPEHPKLLRRQERKHITLI